MADKTITLAFDADTSAAEKKLRELGRAASGEQGDGGEGGGTQLEGVGDVVINSPASVTINGVSVGTQPQPQQPGGPPPGGSGSTAPSGGKPAADRSTELLSAVISSALIQKGLALSFNLGRDPLTSNRSVDKTEGAVMGGIGGIVAGLGLAKAGALIGAPAGPVGMGIGALVGLLGGAGLGWAGANKAAKDQDRMAIYSRVAEEQLAAAGGADAASDDAFMRMLALNPSIDDSLGMVRRRRRSIASGAGERSVASLGARMQEIEDAGITDSAEYQELGAERSRQMARVAQLEGLEREIRYAPMMGLHRQDASDYADAYQRMGLTAGATVDVGATNREIVDLLRELRDSLREMADTGLEKRFATPASKLLVVE